MAILSNPMAALATVNRLSGLSKLGSVTAIGGEGGDQGGGTEGGGSSSECGSDCREGVVKKCENEGGIDAFCDVTTTTCIDGVCVKTAECRPAEECCSSAGAGSSSGATCSAGSLVGM